MRGNQHGPFADRTHLVQVPTSKPSQLLVPVHDDHALPCRLPVDLLALPATGSFYLVEDARSDGNADLLSILLFPSVVLWKMGALLGAPFDALEFVAWRSWREPAALSAAERERVELRWDDEALPRYPVAPVFPLPTDPVGG